MSFVKSAVAKAIFYVRACLNFALFYKFSLDFGKFGTADVHNNLLSDCKLQKKSGTVKPYFS